MPVSLPFFDVTVSYFILAKPLFVHFMLVLSSSFSSPLPQSPPWSVYTPSVAASVEQRETHPCCHSHTHSSRTLRSGCHANARYLRHIAAIVQSVSHHRHSDDPGRTCVKEQSCLYGYKQGQLSQECLNYAVSCLFGMYT